MSAVRTWAEETNGYASDTRTHNHESRARYGDNGDLHAEFVVATKEIVESLLARNTHNRDVRNYKVDEYARDIENDDWIPNNQGIGLSRCGRLIDGQHRLLALQKLGYPPVKVLLCTGLDPNAVSTVDIGIKRMSADTISLLLDKKIAKQYVGSMETLANIRWKGSWMLPSRGYGVNTRVLASWIHAYSDAMSAFRETINKENFFRYGVRAALTAYLHAFPVKASSFIARVESGENLTREMPAYHLRDILLHRGRANVETKLNDFSCAVKCINSDHLGLPMRMWKRPMSQDWCSDIRSRLPFVESQAGSDSLNTEGRAKG